MHYSRDLRGLPFTMVFLEDSIGDQRCVPNMHFGHSTLHIHLVMQDQDGAR
jgi:hypothetical protein